MLAPRTAARALALLVAVCVASMAMVGAVAVADTPPATTWAAQENTFVSKINAERTRRGLRRLAVDLQLTRVARAWSGVMNDRDRMAHNPDLGRQVKGSWTRLGENVGYTMKTGASAAELVRRLHTAFMNSPGHRANVLGDYNRVGVGVRMAADRTMWVTVNFSKADGAPRGAAVRDAAEDARSSFAGSDARRADFAVVAPSANRELRRNGARLAADDAPLLLTLPGDSVDPNPVLHPTSRAAIDAILGRRGTIYLVGDRDRVSARVEAELTADGYRVRRLATSTAVTNAALALQQAS